MYSLPTSTHGIVLGACTSSVTRGCSRVACCSFSLHSIRRPALGDLGGVAHRVLSDDIWQLGTFRTWCWLHAQAACHMHRLHVYALASSAHTCLPKAPKPQGRKLRTLCSRLYFLALCSVKRAYVMYYYIRLSAELVHIRTHARVKVSNLVMMNWSNLLLC